MTLLVGTAVAALALGLVPAIASAVGDPAGTAVTAPKPSTVRAARSALVSDETGWLESDGRSAAVYTAADYTSHTVDTPDAFVTAPYQVAGGGYAAGFNPDTATLTAIRFSTGDLITSDASALTAAYDSLGLIGTTGDEWVLGGQTLDTFSPVLVMRPFDGGGDVVLAQPPSVDYRQALAAGPAGTLVADSISVDDGFGNLTSSLTVSLIAPGGGSTTVIASDLPVLVDSFPGGAVSSTHVAWRTDTGFSLAPIAGGSVVSVPVAVERLDGLVVSKGVAFWVDYLDGEVRMADASGVVKTLVAPNPEAGIDMPRPSTLQNGTAAAVATASRSVTDAGSLNWFSYSSTSPAAFLAGPFEDLQLDVATQTAGQVYGQYATDPSAVPADPRTSAMFVRSIGGSPLAYGAESALLSRASRFGYGYRLYRGSKFGDGFSFSGRRGAVPTWPSASTTTQELTLLDNGSRTSGLAIGKVISVSQSGPYTAFVRTSGAGGVATPDGTIVAALPTGIGHAEQDGPRVVYATGTGEVWLRDVTKAASATNPRKLLAACATPTVDCSRDYSIWGPRVVVTTSKDGVPEGGVDAFDVTTGARTTLANITGALSVRLRGDVLSYVTSVPNADPNRDPDIVIRFADLSAPTPTPSADSIVDVGGGYYVTGRGYTGLDGHRVWWASPYTLKTAAIPASVDSASAPRLLGSTGARELYRVGAALSAPWTPTFDLDQPLTSSWTLTISSGATTVRTFTGSGTVGLRGISWNGKDTGGTLVPDGTYTWTLTGSNADGSLVSSLGSGAATGTLLVATPTKSRITLRTAPSSITYGSAARLTATLVNGSGTGVAGQTVEFYGRARGATTWVKVGSATTTSAGAAALAVKPSAAWQYYAKHPVSAALLPISSSSVSVAVAFKVGTTWKASKVKRGKKVLLTGVVGPTVGGSVVVQRKSGKKWVKVVGAALRSGRFSVKVKVPATKGSVTYRVVKAADSTHLAGKSATKRIKVT
jgi:hypothetical protein